MLNYSGIESVPNPAQKFKTTYRDDNERERDMDLPRPLGDSDRGIAEMNKVGEG